MIARIIAGPVMAHLNPVSGSGILLGSSGSAAHIAIEDFVVAITGRRAPLFPNGISVTAARGAWPAAGAHVRLLPGRIEAGGESVVWEVPGADRERGSCAHMVDGRDQTMIWDPSVPVARHASKPSIAARGESVLAALGLRGDRGPRALAAALAETGDLDAGRRGPAALLQALTDRDPDVASDAAELLTGRGQGLTPRGDDLLAGAASAVAALGPAAGWGETHRRKWLAALAPPDLRRRTTTLSATLLSLATTGLAMEPVHGVLDVEGDRSRWRRALQRLCGVGHSTGPAYAMALGASAVLIGEY